MVFGEDSDGAGAIGVVGNRVNILLVDVQVDHAVASYYRDLVLLIWACMDS